MYAVAVSRTFVAQHYLTVPNPGPEGSVHSHTYTVEATLRGPELDEHGYLIDIEDLSATMDAVTDFFRDETLNDLPAFDGLNPSVERLAKVFADRLRAGITLSTASNLTIAIQEDAVATVEYTTEF